MPRTMSIDALGAVIEIDGSALSDDAWTAARAAWQDASIEMPTQAPAATVAAHGGLTDQSMLSGLSMEVTFASLHARAGELLMLHAAGLADENGGVVVLVGPSGRGKTTASRVLGREFGYVSDESVGIATDGTVLPYRKPLSLIEHDQSIKVQRSPSELGLRPLPEKPLRLAALVLLDRTTDACPPRLERVDIAEGIAAVAEQASYLGRTPAPLHLIAAHIEAVGGVHRLTYADAASLVPIVRELGARVPDIPQTQTATCSPDASPEGDTSIGQVSSDPAPRYRRVPVLDSLTIEAGRVALLVRIEERTRIVVLDGVAPTLWRAAGHPVSLEDLVTEAVDVHGEPQGIGALSLVEASVSALVGEGLLTRV